MTERPILFSGPMVRAILAGRKTQTRRAMRIQPRPFEGGVHVSAGVAYWDGGASDAGCPCPYGDVGGRLWVRENGWERPERTPKMMREGADTWAPYYFDADGEDATWMREHGFKRRPSIHMPRWACRAWLEVASLRVERLQAISELDAMAEGCEAAVAGQDASGPIKTFRTGYVRLWNSINEERGLGWLKDPWVWVVTFRPIKFSSAAKA